MPNNIQVDNKYLQSIYDKYGENNPYGITKKSGYIENTDGNNLFPNKTSGDNVSLRGPRGTSKLDVLEYSEDSIYTLINGLNPEDCYVKNKDGYYELKEDVLQFIMDRIKSLNNTKTFVAMSGSEKLMEMVYETMSGDVKDAEDRARQAPEFLDLVLKNNKNVSETINSFVSELFQKVLEDNQDIFTKRMDEIDEEADEWHDSIPFCDDEEWVLEEQRDATIKFYNAMRNSLLSMKKAFNQSSVSGIDPVAVEQMNKIAEAALNKIQPPDIKVIEEDDPVGGANLGLTLGILVEGVPGLGALIGGLIGGFTGTKERLSVDQLIDVNAFKKELSDLKSSFDKPINAQRNQLAGQKSNQQLRGLVFETKSEIEAADSKIRGVEQGLEEEAAQKTESLDRIISVGVVAVKLQNQAVKLNRNLEKHRSFESRVTWFLKSFAIVAALVVAVVGLIFSWTVVGLAIAVAAIAVVAAASALANAYLTAGDDISDEISEDEHDEGYNASGQTIDDVLKRANDALNSINRSYIENTSDGKKRINDDKIATKTAELASAQAGLRVLNESRKTNYSLTGVVFSAMSGIRAVSSANPLIDAVYQTEMQNQFSIFNRLVSALSEYVTAKNTAIAQAKALTDAWISAGITVALSWACAGVGAGIGTIAGTAVSTAFSVGYGLGQAAGGVLGEVGSNSGWWSDSPLDKEYDNVDTNKYNMSSNVPEGPLEASIDYVEANIFSDLFKDGIMNTGDGYKGLNTNKIAELQKRMAQIANTKAILTLTQKLRQSLNNTIVSTMSGISTVQDQTSLQTIQAQYNASMQRLDHLSKVLNKKVEMSNASRDAQKAINNALIRGSVQVAVSVVGGVLSALTSASQVAAIASALIGFINIVTEMALALENSKEDYGDINLKDQEEELHEQEKRENDRVEAALLDRARQAQSQKGSFSKGIITDLGGGKIGVNSGHLSSAQQQIRNFARVQKMVAEMLEEQQENKNKVIRAMGGVSVSNQMALRASVNNMLWALLKATQSSFSGLQTYIQRHNQINDYERQFYQALVRGVFEAVVAYVSASQASDQSKAAQAAKKIDGIKNPDNKERLRAETAKTKANEKIRKLAPYSLAIQVVREWLDVISGAIYDDTASTGYTERKQAQEDVNQTKAALRGDKGAKGMASIDSMKADRVASQYEMGEVYLNKEVRRAQSRLTKAIMNNVNNIGKSGLEKWKTMESVYRETSNAARLDKKWSNQEEQITKTLASLQKIRLDAEYKTVFNPQQATQMEKAHQTFMKALEQPSRPSSKMLLEMAEHYIKKSEETMGKMQEANKEMKPLLKKLKRQAKELRKTREKQIALKTKEKKKADATQIAPESKLYQDPTEGFMSAKEIEKKLTSLQQEIDELKELETHIKNRPPAELDPTTIQKFRRVAQGIQAKTAEIQAAMNLPQAQVEAAEATVSAKATMATKEQIDNVLDQLSKDKGKPLEDMTAIELQELYDDLYEKIFMPARETRQATLRLRNAVLGRQRGKVLEPEKYEETLKFIDLLRGKVKDEQKRINLNELKTLLIKGELTEREQHLLTTILDTLEGLSAETMQKVMGFNKLVGKINRLHKEKTAVPLPNGKMSEGSDLIAYSEKRRAEPAMRKAKVQAKVEEVVEERLEGAARELPVQIADVPVKTLQDRSGTLLARLETKVGRIKSTARQLRTSSQLAEEAYAAS